MAHPVNHAGPGLHSGSSGQIVHHTRTPAHSGGFDVMGMFGAGGMGSFNPGVMHPMGGMGHMPMGGMHTGGMHPGAVHSGTHHLSGHH